MMCGPCFDRRGVEMPMDHLEDEEAVADPGNELGVSYHKVCWYECASCGFQSECDGDHSPDLE